MDIGEMKNKLLKEIGKKRYDHSVRVEATCRDLAKKHGLDQEKAGLAGLLHDCGKYEDRYEILKKAQEFDIISSNSQDIQLLHSELGSLVARYEYGILDRDILRAISYHTTGSPAMGDLEKVVYLGDAIEPYRDFPGLEEIRLLAYNDLDKACLMLADRTLKFLIDRGLVIEKNTIDFRNYLLVRGGS